MVVESPTNNAAKQEVDQTFQAARVSPRPWDYRGASGSHPGGHFRRIFTTGALTNPCAAGAALFSARFANADRVAMINRIRAWATVGTVFGAAQEVSLDVARVNAFTVGDTGGTAISPLGEDGKKLRSMMRSPLLTDLRIATVGALTPGTGVEEQPMGGGLFAGLLNVAGSMAMTDLMPTIPGQEHPLMLAANEGFRIRNRTAFGAGGVVVMTFEIDWAEIPSALIGQ